MKLLFGCAALSMARRPATLTYTMGRASNAWGDPIRITYLSNDTEVFNEVFDLKEDHGFESLNRFDFDAIRLSATGDDSHHFSNFVIEKPGCRIDFVRDLQDDDLRCDDLILDNPARQSCEMTSITRTCEDEMRQKLWGGRVMSREERLTGYKTWHQGIIQRYIDAMAADGRDNRYTREVVRIANQHVQPRKLIWTVHDPHIVFGITIGDASTFAPMMKAIFTQGGEKQTSATMAAFTMGLVTNLWIDKATQTIIIPWVIITKSKLGAPTINFEADTELLGTMVIECLGNNVHAYVFVDQELGDDVKEDVEYRIINSWETGGKLVIA